MQTTPENVLELFGQLFEAERELARAKEQYRLSELKARTHRDELEQASAAVARLRERIEQLARKAAGVPEPEPDQPARREFVPVKGRTF